MLTRAIQSLTIACLFLGSLSAATDPFVGKWKLNPSKSKMTGEQEKIEALGGNKYTFTFGEISDTLVADGTDQPMHYGSTRAITEEGPNTWKLVDKKDGRTLGTGTWTLSQDGKTMTMDVTGTQPDGSTFHFQETRKRIAGTSGFAGTWEDTSVTFGSPDEFEIQPYEGDGLTFFTPAQNDTLSMKFDGKDYTENGPNVASGSTSSGRRVNARTLEMTDKVQNAVMDTTEFKVSPDGKALTLTVHDKGQSKPLTIVYDRE
ncbi:MAG TPA: hypothetical protein VGW33_13865 [Terriglobia bacterium]|nr:hypothetical protein [Terriglobia bacterium]